jgi:hypothetical protein
MVTGHDPIFIVDHRNTDPFDNRWVNLRESGATDNAGNRNCNKIHSTGFKGVRRHRRKFYARCNGKFLGMFNTAPEAHAAYVAAAKQHFGPFFRP